MRGSRPNAVALGSLLAASLAIAQPPPVTPPDAPAPGVDGLRLADPLILAEDPSPLASKLTVTGKTMSNGTYRLTLRYEPGRGVSDSLGKEGLERLSFLVYSEPSRSLLALFLYGGDDEEAAQRGEELGALTTAGLPWNGALEGTTYLPHPPDSDKTVSVEMLAFDRRARVLGAEEPNVFSFTASSFFREMSLLESGEPEG